MHVLQSRLLLEDPAGAAIAAQVFAPRFRPRAVGLLPGDLAPTGVAAATYGDGTHVAQVAVGVDGRVASAANVAITGEDAGLNLAHAAFLPRRALPLVPTGVTPGTYGDGSHVAQETIAADGRVTSATSVAISSSTITAGTAMSGGGAVAPGGSVTLNVAVEDAGLNIAAAAFRPRPLPLVPTGVLAGQYGDGTHVAKVTVGADGRLTAVSSVGISVDNGIVGGRLTLQSGAAVQTADQTAATTLYYDPYRGNAIALPWSGAWQLYTFSEQSVLLTDSSQSGAITLGLKTCVNLTSTAQLVRGMQVTGTGIGANCVISSIDTANNITLSVASTASNASTPLTFKLPASTNYDVYAVPTAGNAFRLQLGNAWTNGTTRADAITQAGALNGVLVNNAAINAADFNTIAAQAGRYLGTIQTTATAGQSESGLLNRLVYNFYNKEPLAMEVTDGTSHTYGTNTTRQWRAQAANQLNFILGQPQDLLPTVAADLQPPLGDYGVYGLTLDSTSTEDVVAVSQGASSSTNQFDAGVSRVRHVGIGQHYVAATQRAVSGSVTFGSLKLGMLLLG